MPRIASVFGRLAYIASHRNPDTGRFVHEDLALHRGERQADSVLRAWHQRSFLEWLGYPLAQQAADLRLFVLNLGLSEGIHSALHAWAEPGFWQKLPPETAIPAERQIFYADLRVLVAVLRADLPLADDESGGDPRLKLILPLVESG